MSEMQELSKRFQDATDEESFKNLIEVKELDEWSFALIRNLQDIEQKHAVKIASARESLQKEEYDFLKIETVKKAMKDRGLEVLKDKEIQVYFNNVIMMGINSLLTKTKAREMAKEVVDKAIKKPKSKKRKK